MSEDDNNLPAKTLNTDIATIADKMLKVAPEKAMSSIADMHNNTLKHEERMAEIAIEEKKFELEKEKFDDEWHIRYDQKLFWRTLPDNVIKIVFFILCFVTPIFVDGWVYSLLPYISLFILLQFFYDKYVKKYFDSLKRLFNKNNNNKI